MERSLGSEIAIAFGERLRRLYAQDELALPPQVAASLDRLRRAEQGSRAQGNACSSLAAPPPTR